MILENNYFSTIILLFVVILIEKFCSTLKFPVVKDLCLHLPYPTLLSPHRVHRKSKPTTKLKNCLGSLLLLKASNQPHRSEERSESQISFQRIERKRFLLQTFHFLP